MKIGHVLNSKFIMNKYILQVHFQQVIGQLSKF
jgi:hypothetical protein